MTDKVFILPLDPDQTETLRRTRQTSFTVAVDRETDSPGIGRVAVIFEKERSDHRAAFVGWCRNSGKVTTFDRRLSVENLHRIPGSQLATEVSRSMSSIHHGALKKSLHAGGQLTERASTNFRNAATCISDDLWALAKGRRTVSPTSRVETLHQQRDAVSTALNLAGFDPARASEAELGDEYSVLASIRPLAPEASFFELDLHYFDLLETRNLREHIAVFKEEHERVEIMNINATKQEHATDVDLLYFVHSWRSFFGVQYKSKPPLLEPNDDASKTLCRVDERLRRQIDQMMQLEAMNQPPIDHLGYRLGGRGTSMFLKFARPSSVNLLSTGMAKGWHLPAALAAVLTSHDEGTGIQPSTKFTFQNITCWMTNDEFCSLVRIGWIGSVGISPPQLNTYITEALYNKRPLALAIKEQCQLSVLVARI